MMQMIWYNKPHPDDSDDGAHGYIKYAEIDVVNLLAPESSSSYNGHPGWGNPSLCALEDDAEDSVITWLDGKGDEHASMSATMDARELMWAFNARGQ